MPAERALTALRAQLTGEPGADALARAARGGDLSAFEGLVRRYQRRVYGLAYRHLQDPDEAQDLAQEVFFKAYRSLERFDPTFRFSTWLYRIASNRSIDHLRRQAPVLLSLNDSRESEKGPEGVIQLKSAAHGPEDLLASRELGEQISQAIDALPSSYRELILLRHLQGMAYEEIARMKRLPLGTVKNRLFRAREILRKRLES